MYSREYSSRSRTMLASATATQATSERGQPGQAEVLHGGDHHVAAGHREHAVGEVHEAHQAHGDGEPHGNRVQDHAVRESVERDADETGEKGFQAGTRCTQPPADGGCEGTSRQPRALRGRLHDVYFWLNSFQGSLTIGMVSISTFWTMPLTLRVSRTYSFCTTSRVRGSISTGPRGLFGFFHPRSSSMVFSGSILPFCAATTSQIACIASQAPTEMKLGHAFGPYSFW